MTYLEQLDTKLWKSKRQGVLSRDKNCCTNCFNENYINELKVGILDDSQNFSRIIFNHSHGTLQLQKLPSIEIDLVVFETKDLNKIGSNTILYYAQSEDEKSYLMASRVTTNEELLLIKENPYSDVKSPDEIFNHPLRSLDKFGRWWEDRNLRLYNSIHKSDFKNLSWLFVKGLHIHHTYYKQGALAWEYPDEALTTLCYHCHEQLHQDTKVPVYDNQMNLIDNYQVCKRCYGAGWFPEYLMVQGGICFRCKGKKYEELI